MPRRILQQLPGINVVFLFGESLRSIQDSGSLSSVSSPNRNILFFPLGSRWVSFGWTTLGLLVLPALLRGVSTTAEFSWVSYNLRTSNLTLLLA